MATTAEPETTSDAPSTQNPQGGMNAGGGHVGMAFLIAILGLGLAGFGLYRMYDYGIGDQIVGGDAYNYGIIATRGVGWIAAGIASILFSVLLAVVAIWEQGKEFK